MAVSKSTQFIPKLDIGSKKLHQTGDFDNFEETAHLSFNNVKLKKQLSGSKSQANLKTSDVKVQNFTKKNCQNSKFKSGNKRRRSLSRTKSFVDPSSGYKFRHQNEEL
jgi:hypothetical protein